MKTALEHQSVAASDDRVQAEPPRAQPSSGQGPSAPSALWRRKSLVIATLSMLAIAVHLALRFGFGAEPGISRIPLLATLAVGGIPLLYDLLRKLLRREFGSDLLGGISIVTSILLGEYLAGSIIVLMLSGGEALESYALRSASSVLAALPSGCLRSPTGDGIRKSWTWDWTRWPWATRS